MDRGAEFVCDESNRFMVVIRDIRFKGKRRIDWDEVKKYLKQYVGDFYRIAETNDSIYIGKDLPDEYTGSKYTEKLKGTNAKAKANAAQGIPELIEIAVNRRHKENLAYKHRKNAKLGWYRYDSYFALPVYKDSGEIERYNVFQAELLIRHDADGRLYLYDVVNIKKETSTPPSLMHTVKNPFL